MRTDELDYELPESAIAVRPAEPRDSARLMVVRRGVGVEHMRVSDLPAVLGRGDLLVFNASRVLPARFLGRREDTGGGVQGLYLRDGSEPGTWEVMLKARRFKEGARVRLAGRDGSESGVVIELVKRLESDEGGWVVRVRSEAEGDAWAASHAASLERVGLTPLPPYILGARRRAGVKVLDELDRGWYQTVYAREGGSVAAPTAGLHFTPRLLSRLEEAGVERAEVVLHVGTGTFKPVETERVEDHRMHTEWCSMSAEVASRVQARVAREVGGRVIAVGTTAARTLEAYGARLHGQVGTRPDSEGGGPVPAAIETDILITPGHEWRWVQGLMTNFHLPRSTLMAMVAALLPGGVEELKALYREAIGMGYRFYSYGDAMVVV